MCNCGNVFGGIVFPDFVGQSCCNPCCRNTAVGGVSDDTGCELCGCLKKLCKCLNGGQVGGVSDNTASNCCKPCGCGCGQIGGVSTGCGCHTNCCK